MLGAFKDPSRVTRVPREIYSDVVKSWIKLGHVRVIEGALKHWKGARAAPCL